MLLQCRRNKLKESSLSSTSRDYLQRLNFLHMLNKHNIQHFTFDTLTNDIVFTNQHRTKVLPGVYVNVFIIDSLCTITNKSIETLKLIEAYKKTIMNTPDFFDAIGHVLPSDLQKSFGSTQAVKPTISKELLNFILTKAGIASVEEAEKLLSESKSKKLDLELELKLLKQCLDNRDY